MSLNIQPTGHFLPAPRPSAEGNQLAKPILYAGPVSFFQSRSIHPNFRLVEREQFKDFPPYGNHLYSNERHYAHFFEPLQNSQGGVLVGIGSFQNLNLAAAAQAAGLIIVDFDPLITLTLALLLPLIPSHDNPVSFWKQALRLLHPVGNRNQFLRAIPEGYHSIFWDHINALQRRGILGRQLIRVLRNSLGDENSFLHNKVYFDHIANLVKKGAISIIYGDFFSSDMPFLIESALNMTQEKVRSLYMTNVLEWHVNRGLSLNPHTLTTILEAPWIDPQGHLLMTMAFSRHEKIRQAIRTTGYAYHAPTIATAKALLKSHRSMNRFVAHFEESAHAKAGPL